MIDELTRLKRIDYGDKVYYDAVRGIAGTTYPIGTAGMPSNTIANVITICAARNLRIIEVYGSVTLGATMSGYRFEGTKHLDIAFLVDVNSQDVSVSSFHQLNITGAQAGAGLAAYDDCVLLTMTGFNGSAHLCGLVTSLALAPGTLSQFIKCFSLLGTCTITLGTPTVANFVDLGGSIILVGQTAGLTNIWAMAGCEIVINNSCNGGTINIYGNARVTDNSAVGCTVNDYTKETQLNSIEEKVDTGGLGVGLVSKALTFANQIGQVALFTVTGDVIVRLVSVVKTNCGTSTACTISIGTAVVVDAIIPVTDITLLTAQEIWFDVTPDSEIEALATMREHIISDGNDITLNSSTADNSGAITFYCFWTALSSGATVVAA